MKIRKSLLLGIWLVLIINLLLALGTVTLLNRLSPAITKISAENQSLIDSGKNISKDRTSIQETEKKAVRLLASGVWGVVFLAVLSFICGLIFIRHLNRRVLIPLDELYNVMQAHKKGDQYRRCMKRSSSSYFYFIFEEINSLIDRQSPKI